MLQCMQDSSLQHARSRGLGADTDQPDPTSPVKAKLHEDRYAVHTLADTTDTQLVVVTQLGTHMLPSSPGRA